jgi:type III pantothenate kinase
MLLAVEVGNTETTVGVFDGEKLAHHWRVSTVASRTADEHALVLTGLLGMHGLGFDQLDGMAISSVVPRVGQTLRDMTRRTLHTEPVVVGPGVRTGIPILTDNPREVGADRVVNAVAAFAAYGGPVIVVDFGTATTFDAVSERGELLGVAIAPGLQISVNALAERTAQLGRVELVRPRAVIGRNTTESLQAGIVFGTAGEVDTIVRRMTTELGGHATTVATGGLAPVIFDTCETLEHHDPWLTLRGLRMVYDLNTGDGHPGRRR